MTRSSNDSTALINELVAILRLTRTEAQVARVRVTQAQREEIRRELDDNAREADARAARIQDALRRLGGAPDLLGGTVGRVTAATKVAAEQALPLSEGILGDLSLEHQLRDRVVFARVLAEAQNQSGIVDLMHDLEAAHTETVEWLRVRLAEVAQGGPAGLAPTPAQAGIGTLARFATLPTRQSAAIFNRTADALQRGRDKARQVVRTTATKARVTADATEQVVSAGRDAAVKRAEEVAPNAEVRKAARKTREDLGTVDAEDLPVADYDSLSGQDAIDAVNHLDDAEKLRVVLRYEQAHKARKGVSTAAQKRLTELADGSVSA